MVLTRSNSKKTTPSRRISNGCIPLAPSRKGGLRNKVRVTGRNLLGAFTAALTPRTPVMRQSSLLCDPPALNRAKGPRASHRVAGRILFAETPRKTPSALLAPDAPLKAAAPETPIAWIKRMGKIWDSVMLPLTK